MLSIIDWELSRIDRCIAGYLAHKRHVYCQTLSLENTTTDFPVCRCSVRSVKSEALDVFPKVLASFLLLEKVVQSFGELDCFSISPALSS